MDDGRLSLAAIDVPGSDGSNPFLLNMENGRLYLAEYGNREYMLPCDEVSRLHSHGPGALERSQAHEAIYNLGRTAQVRPPARLLQGRPPDKPVQRSYRDQCAGLSST
jgi:hypothetical protein